MHKNKQPAMISVEIIYATSEQQRLISIEIPLGSTVEAAITLSGMLSFFPAINLNTTNKVGIFGHLVSLSTLVQMGDRIEIYNPLMIDPKQARLLRQAAHSVK